MSGSASTAGATGVGELLRGIGRAFDGAILFALPILMTMEVWELAYLPPTSFRKAALLFTKDPRQVKLTVRVSGYELP